MTDRTSSEDGGCGGWMEDEGEGPWVLAVLGCVALEGGGLGRLALEEERGRGSEGLGGRGADVQRALALGLAERGV